MPVSYECWDFPRYLDSYRGNFFFFLFLNFYPKKQNKTKQNKPKKKQQQQTNKQTKKKKKKKKRHMPDHKDEKDLKGRFRTRFRNHMLYK